MKRCEICGAAETNSGLTFDLWEKLCQAVSVSHPAVGVECDSLLVDGLTPQTWAGQPGVGGLFD